VAETETVIYMLEPKEKSALQDADVLAKRAAAVKWCKQATDHARTYGGKPWQYVLIPHEAIAENATLDGLSRQFAVNDE
jgi:type III restriction enzyme